MPLILYQRDECHLCDLALLELARAGLNDFDSVFIDDDPALEARYGTRVPVLSGLADGGELDWPFDAGQLRQRINPPGAV
ncbi:glutaredoxin family protein [Pseudomarimonas salicorniae]|uniref:Glutaredoxin family protein n=1 Tax=Pseudomarimonas salicorniae TaxID=2933270 RepID=A0ABT0GC18_9GAMM|nr:glutaredoxin family protein [Lysobacter sp. CAU 1642]MCK7592076.1 glutaredoxin family protein [Lysobacter sp. CAU 1642]